MGEKLQKLKINFLDKIQIPPGTEITIAILIRKYGLTMEAAKLYLDHIEKMKDKNVPIHP